MKRISIWAAKYASSIYLVAGTVFFIGFLLVWLNYSEFSTKYEEAAVYVVLAAYGIQIWWAFTICPRQISHELKQNYYATYNYCWLATIVFLFVANWWLVGYNFDSFDIHFSLPLVIILGGLIGWTVGGTLMVNLHDAEKYAKAVMKNNFVADNADYRTPMYVFADNTESETLPSRNAKSIIGYRISPTLVIHSVTGNNCWLKKDVEAFCKRYNGELLDAEDVKVLRQNWEYLSDMRLAVGETVLPEPRFWYNSANGLTSAHCNAGNKDRADVEVACIIMKVPRK